ncbi:hypothetical protein RSK20926_21385 [Roseobacter sp. SK209-2-6]|uniref:nickel/cobalt transporter n=1 Tax=Roseobacter sp. SK209-2-6 TaxID=388739 RepID=UPI0000F3E75E|nr:membrane protein [Roseobacter sp. SK209-2-6]EBA16321.1 hypothetical protein RSK20926_21385 [Roseobacter sp. SK209-2-6]
MSKLLILVFALFAALVAWIWGAGLFDPVADWAAGQQYVFQNRIARGLRALRAGETGALLALMSLCFAYGFFHAVGPGHGKILLGGYGLGRKVPLVRLGLIGLFSSLGQGAMAILLVYSAVWIFNLTRQGMVDLAEEAMAPVSYAAIVLIGAWLMLRGLRRFWALGATTAGAEEAGTKRDHPCSHGSEQEHLHGHSHDHNHRHSHGTEPADGKALAHSAEEVCSSCGHRHGPSLAEAEAATSLREALVLIAGIAIRPCTGALFVLVITWQMGIALAGVMGVIAMALGTASVTITVALAASGLRGGLLLSLAGSDRGQRLMPVLEVTAGLLVVLMASGLLLTSLR